MASNIIKSLDGTNEEKLGQFEMIEQTEAFHKKYPGFVGKDVAEIIRLQLSKFWKKLQTLFSPPYCAESFFIQKELENDYSIPLPQRESLSAFLHHFYFE